MMTTPKFSSRCLLGMALVALVNGLSGCKSPAPTVIAAPPIPSPASELRVDDIPPNASPAVRAHLIKLREMRDLGQISDGDYQSRKALLLGP